MDTLDSMSGKRKSYPVPTDKILEDNWHYEKPVTKEFSTVETPTKKKRAKVRQQPRKWAPSQHNSQILEQAFVGAIANMSVFPSVWITNKSAGFKFQIHLSEAVGQD